MPRIFEYLRLLLFMSGVLIGIQIPNFVNLYGKILNARLGEVSQNLAQFQQDADKYFAGDIEKLIRHYQVNADTIIADGGASIEKIYQRKQLLTSALNAFNENSYQHISLSAIEEIRLSVWQNYDYALLLNSEAIFSGISVGFLVAFLADFFIWLLTVLSKTVHKRVRLGVS